MSNEDMIFVCKGTNKYSHKEQIYTWKDLGEFIKEGKRIKVEDKDGCDETQLFMMVAAFGDELNAWNYLYYTLTRDELEDIIESGGSEQIVNRKIGELRK